MLTTMAARASDTPATAEELYLAKLQTANDIAKARYGDAATPKAGEVAGGDKLAAMALLLEPRAYDKVAADVVERAPKGDRGIFITSKADVAGLVASARLVQGQIESMICEGKPLAREKPCTQDSRFMLTLPAVMATAGAADSLVGLFRSDYSVSAADLEANLLGLQLAIQRRMSARARIDGLSLYPAGHSDFGNRLLELDRLRADIAATNPKDGTKEAIFVTAVKTVLTQLRTLSDTGIAPAARIGLLLDQTRDLDAVLYVNIIKPTGTAVTTRRLFSLNRKVHLHLTGLVNAVYQVSGGAPDSKTYHLGESATLDLRDLESHSYPSLDVKTE